MIVDVCTSAIDALGVIPGDLVGIAGAGGKTSLMFALAGELAARGIPTLVTTTTRILYPENCGIPRIIIAPETETTVSEIGLAVGRHGLVLAGSEKAESKVVGFSPAFVDRLASAIDGLTVVAECDGARGKSLKVPRPFEPPLAPSTSYLVVVMAADCLGMPIASDCVFEPEDVARVAGTDAAALVDARVAADALLSAASYAGRKPSRARLGVFINKATGIAGPALGAGISIKGDPQVERVVLGSLADTAERRFVVLR